MDTNFNVIVIGGSAGSFQVVISILESLPANFQVPIVLCLHRPRHVREGFKEALNTKSKIMVVEPDDKESIKRGNVYLAPANFHLLLELNHTFALSTEEAVNFSRPAIDLTFETAAYAYGKKMLIIMLSGANSDGAKGMLKAYQKGAYTIVQDPTEAQINVMPESAIKLFKPHAVLSSKKISEFINALK